MKKKHKLILGQKTEPKEQMSFSDPGSRPSPDVEIELSNKDTSFNKVDFPTPPNVYGNYEELLASEEYKDALDKLAEFTGKRNIGTGASPEYFSLSISAGRILREIMNAEQNHEEELEELCVEIIKNHFKIPEGVLNFDFKLTKNNIQVDTSPTKNEIKQREEELLEDINDLTPERAKRRLINAMTQGHAVDGTYLYNTVTSELERILGVNNIIEKYSVFVATMMLGYWQIPNDLLSTAMGSGGSGGAGAGKSRIDTTTDPPTIHATALIFPFLIHEAIKGVMEFLGKEKNPQDAEKYQKAMDLEDQLVHEIWDIRIGPAIWRRVLKSMPNAVLTNENEKMLQSYLYVNIANLPVNEFLISMKEIIDNTEDGKRLMSAMYYDLKMVIDGEDVTEEDSNFRNVMNDILVKHSSDDLDLNDFISELGISLN